MKVLKFLLIVFLTVSFNGFSQTPTDYLSKDFHKERRAILRAKMPANSVSVVFANPLRNRANDVDYVFHQDPNFYYLTGINQQDVTLLMVKGNDMTDSYLFIETIDPVKALWDGAGLSFEEASEVSGIDLNHIKDIKTLDAFINGLLSTNRRASYGLLDHFYLDLDRQSEKAQPTAAQLYSSYVQKTYPAINLKTNQLVLAELRTVKDTHEIEMVKKAVTITEQGLNRIMDTLKPGVYEYEIQAEYNYVLNKHLTSTSFDTIAASGKHATVLHYVENSAKILDNTLMLFDLGVDYKYYCSDVSRTFPVNGKFTKRQKEVYDLIISGKTNKEIMSKMPTKTVARIIKNAIISSR